MFLSTYKNTVKTILRSKLFWISLAALLIVAAPSISGFVSYAPGYEPTSLSVSSYQQHLHNLFISSFLTYAMPLLAVIITVLVLNRDYGDQFFEIEKAADVKPLRYLVGRLCAIFSILLIVQVVSADVLLHIYVASWGGVEGMALGTYIVDSTLRLFMLVFGLSMPCMLFYVSLTYMAGNLFRSGIAGAFGGFGYVILYRALLTFKVYLVFEKQNAVAKIYFEYLCHLPDKLSNYLYGIGTEDEQLFMAIMNTSLDKAALCITFLVCSFVIFAAVSYWRIRKRET